MMANQVFCTFIIATLCGLSGCNATQAQSVEALLVAPTSNTREALQQSIGDFFNSQPVKLAENAFTLKSTVHIERSKNTGTLPINQRGLEPVDSFTLLLVNSECVLRHEQSNKLIALPNINCKAG